MWHVALACILPFPPDAEPRSTADTVDTGVTITPDPLAALSDEFDDPATLARWQEVWQAEGWDQSQLEVLDLGELEPGVLTMIPRATAWYDDWRGPLLFQEVTGDVIVTAELSVTNLANTGMPSSNYSLAGLMMRRHRDEQPFPYQPDQEDWVMLALGRGEFPDWVWEAKTTTDSVPARYDGDFPSEGTLRLARVGDVLVSLVRPPGGDWEVVDQRFVRPDLPETLQVGLVAMSDSVGALAAVAGPHNNGDEIGGNPDLHARFAYARFATPVVPEELRGLDLASGAVTEAQLLTFLGETVP